jgi:uncharacterized protein with FMN-binding domain
MPNASRTDSGGFSRVPKRGAVALVTTILAVLLLFSFKTDERSGSAGSLSARGTPGPVAVAPRPSPTLRPAVGATAPPTGAPAPPSSTGPSPSGTFTGDVIDTRYGNVQVAVVLQAGQIVDVQELQMPSDRRLSAQISQEAGPLLRSEVLQVQSADIYGVSGASYTSYGFYESLQSALAKVP